MYIAIGWYAIESVVGNTPAFGIVRSFIVNGVDLAEESAKLVEVFQIDTVPAANLRETLNALRGCAEEFPFGIAGYWGECFVICSCSVVGHGCVTAS